MAQNSAPRPNNHAAALDQQRVPDQVAAGRGEHAVGGEEQPAFGQRMTGEVQQRDRPREPGQVRQTALPEQQRRAQQRDRDRRILGRGEAEQAPPIFLLECVEHRQDRAEHADGDDEDAEARAVRCAPGSQSSRPRLRPKNAAFSTTPDMIAPDAPLPEP